MGRDCSWNKNPRFFPISTRHCLQGPCGSLGQVSAEVLDAPTVWKGVLQSLLHNTSASGCQTHPKTHSLGKHSGTGQSGRW